MITGLVFRRSLYVLGLGWHCLSVNELRELRRDAHVTQQELADLLKIPVNTFRMWDSGLRRPSAHIVTQAQEALATRARRRQLLPLADLARELGVHVRTLQVAARTGRLQTQFSGRSVFGHPMRFASRAAGEHFIARQYRCFSGQEICPAPLPTVPNDYDQQLRALRGRLRLTQEGLARRVGAAGKAVVYRALARRSRIPSSSSTTSTRRRCVSSTEREPRSCGCDVMCASPRSL